MTINELCKKAHLYACEKGFWSEPYYGRLPNKKGEMIQYEAGRYPIKRNLSELLMLIVSKLGEACEALRKNNKQSNALYGKEIWAKDTFEDELADAVIRICDLCEAESIDLEWQIKKKLEHNKSRPIKHGKEF